MKKLIRMDYGAFGYIEGYKKAQEGFSISNTKRYKAKWREEAYQKGIRMGCKDANDGKPCAVAIYNPNESNFDFNDSMNMFNLFICPVCKFQKVKIPKKTCGSCQELIEDIKKSIESVGYTTWPKLRVDLRVSYASVINKLEYLVKRKYLLPPDESGKYFLKMKLNSSILKKLSGNIIGLLLLIWLFVIVIGNYDSISALLEGKKTVYIHECSENSYDVRGSYCEVYGDGQVLTIKDYFIHSLWTASFITGSLALVILIGYSISEVKHRLSK